jgi:hypothetical protein
MFAPLLLALVLCLCANADVQLFGALKGCGVASFCSVECQKMASHIGTESVDLGSARHKDVCGLLKRWRQVEKGREGADSCTAHMLAFLRL